MIKNCLCFEHWFSTENSAKFKKTLKKNSRPLTTARWKRSPPLCNPHNRPQNHANHNTFEIICSLIDNHYLTFLDLWRSVSEKFSWILVNEKREKERRRKKSLMLVFNPIIYTRTITDGELLKNWKTWKMKNKKWEAKLSKSKIWLNFLFRILQEFKLFRFSEA